MNKKECLVVIMFAIYFVGLPFVLGIADEEGVTNPEGNIIASVSNPRMVLYKTITDGKPVEFTNSVFVNNENNFRVSISLDPQGIWKDHITLSNEATILEAGERKEIFYDIKIDEPGEYPGDIIVTFNKEGYENTLSISQRVVVHVDSEGAEKGTNSGNKILSWSALIFVLILLIILFIVSRKKAVKKNGEGRSNK